MTSQSAQSNAPRGAFCFAQYIADANTCHISLTNPTTAFNVQIPMDQLGSMIDNLLRVKERHTQKLYELTIKQQDEIDAFKKPAPPKCTNCNNSGWMYPNAGVNFPAGAVWGVAGAQAMAHQRGETYLINCMECNKDGSKPHPDEKSTITYFPANPNAVIALQINSLLKADE